MKKALRLIKSIATWLFVIIAVTMMVFTILTVSNFDRNNRSVFGYKFFVVTSDSMASTDFKAGDLVIVRHVNPESLKPEDIITFLSQSPKNFGATVTHKVRSLSYDQHGNPGFITYGTTNDQDDDTLVTFDYVLGKYQGYIPKLGLFASFLKTPPGYIVCILLPFSLLLLSLGIDCIRLIYQYKQEQERRLKAAEEENQQVKTELAMLRAQLAQQAGEGTALLDSCDITANIL